MPWHNLTALAAVENHRMLTANSTSASHTCAIATSSQDRTELMLRCKGDFDRLVPVRRCLASVAFQPEADGYPRNPQTWPIAPSERPFLLQSILLYSLSCLSCSARGLVFCLLLRRAVQQYSLSQDKMTRSDQGDTVLSSMHQRCLLLVVSRLEFHELLRLAQTFNHLSHCCLGAHLLSERFHGLECRQKAYHMRRGWRGWWGAKGR